MDDKYGKSLLYEFLENTYGGRNYTLNVPSLKGTFVVDKPKELLEDRIMTKFVWKDEKRIKFKDVGFNQHFRIARKDLNNTVYRKVNVIQPSIYGALDELTGNVIVLREDFDLELVDVEIKFGLEKK